MSTDEPDLTAYMLFAEEYGWTPAEVDALPPEFRATALDRLAGKRVRKGEMTINDHRRLMGAPELTEPWPNTWTYEGIKSSEPSGERISRYLRPAAGWTYTDGRVQVEFPADMDGDKVLEWLAAYRRHLGDDGAAGTREPRDPKPTPVAPSATTSASSAQTVTLYLDGQELFNAMAPHLEQHRQRWRARNGYMT